MKKKLNFKFLIPAAICLILFTIFYFKFSLAITYDGSYYYYYLRIFRGQDPFSTWRLTRGPSFPLLIFLFTTLFGDNPTGMLIGFYIFYILMLLFSTLILNKALKENNVGKFSSVFFWILYIILIMFNILTIGYSHTLLTEAVMPAIIIFASYLALKWKDIDWHTSKWKVIIYTIIFSFITIFVWFLKQPYAPVIFCILFFSSLLVGISNRSWKILFEKLSCCGIVLVTLLMGIFSWNLILKSNGIDLNQNTSNSSFFTKSIITGLNYHYKLVPSEEYCNINYIENSKLSSKIKEKIFNISSNENWCENIKVYNIVNEGKIIDQEVLFLTDNKISVMSSLRFWVKALITHPILNGETYFKNYMTSINFYAIGYIPSTNSYIPGDNLGLYYNNENVVVGLIPYNPGPTYWWYNIEGEDINVEYMNHYKPVNNFDSDTGNIINRISPFYLFLFKVSLLLLLPMAIYSFIKFLANKKSFVYFLTTVIFASSFIHILFHAVMDAIIDRYAFVVMPISLLGYILILIPQRKEESIMKNKYSIFNKNGRILFVIPAYNEEKHIEKVINDIHKNMPKADIVVTNDYSKDRTKEIVEKMNVPCLNVPFNMGYAMAVQTGIKYAYKNDYDYAILFDADGQHLASEAQKLLKRMEETNANIIIGSRFIEKTNYKHPFFRKIGTKMFQIIIKMFCHKNITDPTSGFQLIDKSVIARYAKIGKYPEFPDANLIIEMLLNGYEIEEVSVQMKLNDEGKSMHGGIIKPIKYMINVTYSIIFILIKGKRNKEE